MLDVSSRVKLISAIAIHVSRNIAMGFGRATYFRLSNVGNIRNAFPVILRLLVDETRRAEDQQIVFYRLGEYRALSKCGSLRHTQLHVSLIARDIPQNKDKL